MSRTVKRAYKYRFYPTPEQAAELARTFGCVRLVYNLALQERTRAYVQEGRRVSYGEKVTNPRHEARDRRRLVKAQRDLSRKTKGSANRAKARARVARVHARVTDRRRDFLHKLTTRLVRENQTVVVEDLTVSNMVKNRSLARAISDASWRELRTMLDYKAGWYGRDLVVVDRWLPSS